MKGEANGEPWPPQYLDIRRGERTKRENKQNMNQRKQESDILEEISGKEWSTVSAGMGIPIKELDYTVSISYFKSL